jgi:acyl-CoA hydrolase
MMGSGKSTVGRAVAARTGWPFVDNDALLERATGRTAKDLLAADGEEALRRAEGVALRDALAMPAPVIIGVAAGAVLDPTARGAMAGDGLVVWLRASAEALAARAAGGMHRPWLEGDAAGWVAATLAERDPLYAEVADLELDTSTLDPAAAAEDILAALRRRYHPTMHDDQARRTEEVHLAELVMPNRTNHQGSLFGGHALGLMDHAGWVAATRYARRNMVTVALDRIEFKVPVHAGQLVELVARVTKVGRTSVTVGVDMFAEDVATGSRRLATSGTFVFVAIGDDERPVPIEGD